MQPDGYLSPQTCAVMGAAMVPVWVVSARQVTRTVKQRDVPLLAIGASFCFLVMMLNVPIPDGTTAHAVGGVIIAILLGRYAATIAVSVALAIQALFFGDGGILAFGANCFNMAFVLPWVGYSVYRLLSGRLSLTASKRAIFAGVGGYVGLNPAALFGAIELGLQPVLFTSADGTPLYAPFHLAQTIPAVMLGHLVVAGVVELVLTAGVVAYLQRANLPVLRINHPNVPDGDLVDAVNAVDAGRPEPAHMSWRWGWIGLGVMVVLSPLGLLAPGGAFGEDAPADLDLAKYGLASIPAGLNRYNGFWSHSLLGLRPPRRPERHPRLPGVRRRRPRGDRPGGRRVVLVGVRPTHPILWSPAHPYGAIRSREPVRRATDADADPGRAGVAHAS